MGDSLNPTPDSDTLVLTEVQLLLAEKRTALSTLRTGIAIFAFPLSVLSVLIATSNLYSWHKVMNLIIPLALINVGLVALGIYLITHAIRRIRHYDRVIAEMKRQHTRLAGLLD